MIVMKEEVYIHRALETGDTANHMGKHQDRSGGRSEGDSMAPAPLLEDLVGRNGWGRVGKLSKLRIG